MSLRRILSLLGLLALSVDAWSQVTTAVVTDPSLGGIKAATLTIPANWKFQGIIMTSPCTSLPFPAYRAYSPDGLTEMRALPVFGWRFSKLKVDQTGCLPMSGPMSAAEFLQKYIEMIPGGVHVVGPVPVSPNFTAWKDKLVSASPPSNGPLHVEHTGDVASLRIETINGTFVVEQRLRAGLFCDTRPDPGPMQGGVCWVRVEVLKAPKGKLDALIKLVDSQNLPHGVNDPEWQQRWSARANQQAADMLRELKEAAQRASDMLRQQHEQFMATMQHNHEAFMAQQEASFHANMNAATTSMNARSTATSDWVDYALDQQTVYGQGGLAKVSSSYSQTWSSTTGNQTQWFQTNDPNANPNGTLSGNWAPDVKVHGNGQPYSQ